ncbi:aminopeptidase [Clostridium felsineum]|uniref:Aminopeptidase YsdC n=1 Tax=Clostridium felsineum TaxID=36839 RepID=A0A1S8LQ25_9CLOT|nr:aminopeptidase [Clostridium felsineum]URZ04751.1 Putative aminopeptidase YsdC [Clostridium felsineum]URZ09792.1 Putative aminopeptidase YsdC [Clostridium felsineum]
MDILLEKVINSFGVSGREKEISEIIKKELKKYDCTVKEDKLGNIIAKVGEGKEKIMLSTSMDTKGVIVYYIEYDGKIRIEPVGELKADDVLGKSIIFRSKIVGKIESDKKENNEFRDLYVKVNMEKKKTVLKYISEGEVGSFSGNIFEDGKNIVGSYLSNRAACFAFLKVIQEIKDINKEVYFVFSTQGNLGGKGARAAAFEIAPNMCISVNTEVEGEIKLGDGPVLVLMGKGLITNTCVKEKIIKTAEENNIKLQRCVSDFFSDGSSVHKEVGGIKTANIALPCKNKDSINEAVNYEDINNLVKLISSIVKE